MGPIQGPIRGPLRRPIAGPLRCYSPGPSARRDLSHCYKISRVIFPTLPTLPEDTDEADNVHVAAQEDLTRDYDAKYLSKIRSVVQGSTYESGIIAYTRKDGCPIELSEFDKFKNIYMGQVTRWNRNQTDLMKITVSYKRELEE